MKTRIRCFIICSLLIISLVSIHATEIEKGIITGKITDTRTQEPIAYASVALVDAADSAIITGTISDEQGRFLMADIPYGKYSLRVSFMGYSPVHVDDIELSKKNRQVELSNLKLAEEITAIGEAVVVRERLKGEEKIDRTVFTLNDDIRKSSTSGLDVLKHIPSVTVDFMENVTLEGQSNIQFYVDGVLRNKDFVAQIDPHSVDKIELITNPGAKYDADISGIINIVLKKEKRYGINGQVQVPVPHPTKILANTRGNIEYGNQNFRLYAGDRMHFEHFNAAEYTITDVDGSFPDPFHYEKEGKGKNTWQNNYLNYGFDLFVNEKTSVNFLGEWWNWQGKNDDVHGTMKTFRNGALSDYSENLRNSLENNNNYYFSLFLKRKFNTEGNELTAEIYHNRQTGRTDLDLTESYFTLADLTIPYQAVYRTQFTNNLKNATEFRIDYTLMTGKVKNEMGIRSYTGRTSNEFNDNNTGEGSVNQAETFTYDENRQAAFYNISGKAGTMMWQAGLRGEYSFIRIDETAHNEYFTLLPQFSLSRSFEKNRNLKFTYRKKIDRPGISALNPFETWIDSLHYRIGNPNLKPSLENRFELAWSKNFGNNFVSPKIYLRYTRDGIQDLSVISPEGVTRIEQDNIGKNTEYGMEFNSAIQVFKRWRFNGNFALFNRMVDSEQDLSVASVNEKVSYRFGISNIVTLPKNFTFNLIAFYGSPNITYQRIFSRDLLMLIGADKKFGEKATLSVFYNPFIRNFVYTKVETFAPGYHEQWWGQVDVMNLYSFEFTYRFNSGKKINKINRSAEYEKNQTSGGL